MTEDYAMMPSEEVHLTNAHESNEAMIEEMSEHDKVISGQELREGLSGLFSLAHRPFIFGKKPISKTPLMSSETASEENTIPLVMTEDNAMIQSEELTNAPESDEAMIEEMIETMISEHDEMISIHEFKEVIHELVKDAVDKIVMKKVGIVEKLKTAKQNLIGHVGEATSREPSQFPAPEITKRFQDRHCKGCDNRSECRVWVGLAHRHFNKHGLSCTKDEPEKFGTAATQRFEDRTCKGCENRSTCRLWVGLAFDHFRNNGFECNE